jgi:hypothetical protein
MQAMLDGDVAVALAQAGLAEQGRARIESNLTRWPDDFSIRLHAGDALPALGDLDGAAAHFDAALRMAEQADDFEDRYLAVQRLQGMGPYGPKEQRRPPASQRRRQAGRGKSSRRKRND